MSEPPHPQRQDPLSARDLAAGEKYADADAHDPGPAEQYAGVPVPDPWEVEIDGELDLGALLGDPAR